MDHPLIAFGLLLVFGFLSVLEVAHIVRVFGKCVLVLIRELKHEVIGARDVGREVKKELSSWEERGRCRPRWQTIFEIKYATTVVPTG